MVDHIEPAKQDVKNKSMGKFGPNGLGRKRDRIKISLKIYKVLYHSI